jgi:hypothetical protein
LQIGKRREEEGGGRRREEEGVGGRRREDGEDILSRMKIRRMGRGGECAHSFQRSKKINFEVGATTVDPKHINYDPSPLIPYLASLGVRGEKTP